MPIICLVLKINVMKMEQAFQMCYKEGEKTFYVSTQNWQGETKFKPTLQSLKIHFGNRRMKNLKHF
jgi:hypothetical protein